MVRWWSGGPLVVRPEVRWKSGPVWIFRHLLASFASFGINKNLLTTFETLLHILAIFLGANFGIFWQLLSAFGNFLANFVRRVGFLGLK